ncbi:hypothetical protein D3C75_708380 [compost metagenome]
MPLGNIQARKAVCGKLHVPFRFGSPIPVQPGQNGSGSAVLSPLQAEVELIAAVQGPGQDPHLYRSRIGRILQPDFGLHAVVLPGSLAKHGKIG